MSYIHKKIVNFLLFAQSRIDAQRRLIQQNIGKNEYSEIF